jgi:hypothetical protein
MYHLYVYKNNNNSGAGTEKYFTKKANTKFTLSDAAEFENQIILFVQINIYCNIFSLFKIVCVSETEEIFVAQAGNF